MNTVFVAKYEGGNNFKFVRIQARSGFAVDSSCSNTSETEFKVDAEDRYHRK
jgi:hypothetical protein